MNHKITEASRDRWLAAAEACPCATYFHTPYWYDLIAPGRDNAALEITFEDGASAVIPVARIKRAGGLLTDHFSSPGGTYGGWISASPLDSEHVKILAGILMSKRNLTFRVNPFDKSQSPLPAAPGLLSPATLRSEFTHTLDLALGEDELYRRTSRCHKRGVRRAAGEGVTVSAAKTWEEWEQHYGLYKSSLERWRFGELATRVVYPLGLFRRIYENAAGREVLWLARKDGKPVAGLLCFYWGRHAVSWHGAASAEFFDLRPNNILYWEAILDAMRKGYEVFDFNPSGGYGGVESFKDRFGAVRVAAPVLATKTFWRGLAARLRRAAKKN